MAEGDPSVQATSVRVNRLISPEEAVNIELARIDKQGCPIRLHLSVSEVDRLDKE